MRGLPRSPSAWAAETSRHSDAQPLREDARATARPVVGVASRGPVPTVVSAGRSRANACARS